MSGHGDQEIEGTNLGLRMLVHNQVDGSKTDLLFQQFPVRIGRNKLNELVLNHPYVSQWHAMIRLAGRELILVQVGSSNSVLVNDRRLTTSEEVELSGEELIIITPYRLHVQLVALPGAQQGQDHTNSGHYAQVGSDGGEQELARLALRILDRLADRFLGRTPQDTAELAVLGQRIEQTLDIFFRFFIALQMGQEQFRQAIEIRSLRAGEANAVEQAKDASELAGLLLSSHTSKAGKELEHAFKNLMIHQVALLNGLMAGVRTLLAKLSPKAVTKEARKDHRSPGGKVLWQTYERMHGDLAEEDNETFETIFGPQFAQAYSALVGQKARTRS